MENKKNEIRTLECLLSVRENTPDAKGVISESRTITGKAIAFNATSEVLDDWGYKFREVILPEACTKEFLQTQDVKMNMLHDRNMTIARCNKGNGSMRLDVREDGVYFEFDAPKCDLGDQALELVRSGVYSGCSFEFYPDEYDIDENGEEVKITHRKLGAVTALTIGMDPAYLQTSVNARELVHKEEPKEEEQEEEPVEEAPAEQPEEEAKAEEAQVEQPAEEPAEQPAEEPQPEEQPAEEEPKQEDPKPREVKDIVADQREIEDKLNDLKDAARGRELDAHEREAEAKLLADYESNKREIAAMKEAKERESINHNNQLIKMSKQAFRELINAARNSKEGVVLGRETAGVSSTILNSGETNNLVTAGAVPQNIMELLPGLQNALVYEALGIKVVTGVKGDIIWPVLASGTTVSINGEAAAVGDSAINFSKVKAAPVRLAASCSITNEAIDDASFDLEAVVKNNLTEALKQAINNALLRSTAVSDGFDGPFTKASSTASLSKVPTYAELIAMKGKVAKKNVQMVGGAFVMNNDLYALLEATPKADGQGGMIIEDGKIGAYPVFATEAIAANKVGFGCFGYAALNNHGETRLIVDPFSAAVQGKTIITLDSTWSLSTLRPEAFCLGTVANS